MQKRLPCKKTTLKRSGGKSLKGHVQDHNNLLRRIKRGTGWQAFSIRVGFSQRPVSGVLKILPVSISFSWGSRESNRRKNAP